MNNSIWAQDVQMPKFDKLSGDLKTDVLIVGGGLAGLLCAMRLQQEGADYALIEADRICGGVSRNTTAKITSQHGLIYNKLIREFGPDTAKGYWMANEQAIAEYRKLAKEIDCDFETEDSFVYSVNSEEKLKEELDALQTLGIPAEYVENPNLPLQVAGAIRFRNQAQFHPLKFAAAISENLRIFEYTPAREFAGNKVIIDGGTISASKIIIATHFPILNKHGAYFLKMYQQRSYVLALEGAGTMQGMYRDEAENGLSFRRTGNYLLLGGGSHRTGKKGGGWHPLEAAAQIYFPGAREVFRWATQDCMTLDGIPYIGRYSRETEHMYVATGFNKWGMTSSMVAADILTDLVLDRENDFAHVFRPDRTVRRKQLFVNMGESAMHLLSPTKPRCPHLGCALQWNPAERSWDCPCHGSRFDAGGTLLDNPATGNLKKDPP